MIIAGSKRVYNKSVDTMSMQQTVNGMLLGEGSVVAKYILALAIKGQGQVLCMPYHTYQHS
jgi:hypothetical protein